MLRTGKAFFALTALLVAAFAWAAEGKKDKDVGKAVETATPKNCVAVLMPTKGSKVEGTITFAAEEKGTHLQGRVMGLATGKHGFHIHEFGDLRSGDGDSAGGHFNPDMAKHGGPHDHAHHAGDLGNIEADELGKAEIDIHADGLMLHFAIGRSIVVHAKADDFKTQPSGDSGPRVAVGVIGIANPKEMNASKTASISRERIGAQANVTR